MSYTHDNALTPSSADVRPDFESVAQLALDAYPESVRGPIEFVTSSENHTYSVHAAQGRYALRIHRPNYHTRSEVEAELMWLSQLHAQGVRVPVPIHGLDGRTTQSVHYHGGVFLVALFPWLPGREPNEAELANIYPRVGGLLARLHQAARKSRPHLDRPCWDYAGLIDNSPWGRWYANPELNSVDRSIVSATLGAITEQLRHYPRNDDTFGIIHADLRPTNILIENEELIAIDFDDCCYSWYLFDVAASVSFLEADDRLGDWIQALLQGYGQDGAFTEADRALLPAFIILRRIQLLAWMGSHRGSAYAQQLNPPLWVRASVGLCQRFLAGPLW